LFVKINTNKLTVAIVYNLHRLPPPGPGNRHWYYSVLLAKCALKPLSESGGHREVDPPPSPPPSPLTGISKTSITVH